MRGYFRRRWFRGVATLVVLGLAACSPSEGSGGRDGQGSAPGAGGGTGNGGAPGTGGGIAFHTGGTISFAGMSSSGTAGVPDIEECTGEISQAQLAALDLNIMLDISGSMLRTGAGTVTKWDAVRGALGAFLGDPGATDLSVGIQYFPLQKPGVPQSCDTTDQCGEVVDPVTMRRAGGMCLQNRCAGFTAASATGRGVAVCAIEDDCNLPIAYVGPCVGNVCQGDSARACTDNKGCTDTANFGPCEAVGRCGPDELLCSIGQTCMDPGPDTFIGTADDVVIGDCLPASSFCFHETVCTDAGYAAPAVDFVPIPGSAAMLTASIDAQVPYGDTPTAPALRGAIQHAREWSLSHPGHQVVAVLATDGFPTECVPDGDFPEGRPFNGQVTPEGALVEVEAAAAAGLQGTPSIPTFVIGVFGAEETAAQANLDRIAVAGGTQTARIVTTDGNVRDQFLEALNSIRETRLACEFQLPPDPPGEDLNFNFVNVVHSDGTTTRRLDYVVEAGNCGPTGGWYYDNDPNSLDASVPDPTRILVCPATCSGFLELSGGTVGIELGCEIDDPE